MARGIWIMSFLLLSSLTAVTMAAGIEMTTVDNPGNAADANGFGSVDYVYHISKYEVTVGQYVEFLNAVAACDTHGLYDDEHMTQIIIRSGGDGKYTYASAEGMANRPITYVSFWDACRFANWLHNGSPTDRGQDLLSTEDGAYFLNGETAPEELVEREEDWRFAIASKNEWYKAAFHDASAKLAASYHAYATGDTISTEMANYGDVLGHTTDVGSYDERSDYYTYDQAGNVLEWNDTLAQDLITKLAEQDLLKRSLSDGSYLASADILGLNKQMPNVAAPSQSNGAWGFRIVSLPEPGSLAVFLASSAAIVARRRRRQSRLVAN